MQHLAKHLLYVCDGCGHSIDGVMDSPHRNVLFPEPTRDSEHSPHCRGRLQLVSTRETGGTWTPVDPCTFDLASA